MAVQFVVKGIRTQMRAVNLVLLLAIVFVNPVIAADATPNQAERITVFPDGKLPLFTTSRVVGSPEPPLPYSWQRRYPNLKLNFPVAIAHQPGSDRIWTVTVDGPKGSHCLRCP